MITHYKHKREPFPRLYLRDGYGLSDADSKYASISNWEPIEKLGSFEEIPQDYREFVTMKGFFVYNSGYSGAFSWLQSGSAQHRARAMPDGLLDLTPIETNEPSIKEFQAVAQAVMNMAANDAIDIEIEHKTSMWPGGLYDRLIISPKALSRDK